MGVAPDLASYSGSGSIGSGGYHADWDLNFDGTVDASDTDLMAAQGARTTALRAGWISDPRAASTGPDNSIGYCGYVFNPERDDYTVRFRVYAPELGRWRTTDPIGYADGGNLYEYVGSQPMRRLDPMGLAPVPDWKGNPGPGNDTETTTQRLNVMVQQSCKRIKDALAVLNDPELLKCACTSRPIGTEPGLSRKPDFNVLKVRLQYLYNKYCTPCSDPIKIKFTNLDPNDRNNTDDPYMREYVIPYTSIIIRTSPWIRLPVDPEDGTWPWQKFDQPHILIHELFHIHFQTEDKYGTDSTDLDDQPYVDRWVKALAESLEKCRGGD